MGILRGSYLNAGDNPAMDKHPLQRGGGYSNTLSNVMCDCDLPVFSSLRIF